MNEEIRILVTRSTRKDLKALKRGGESYDAVIRRLIREAPSP